MKYESEQVRGFIIAECPSTAFNKRTILDYLKVFAKRFSEKTKYPVYSKRIGEAAL